MQISDGQLCLKKEIVDLPYKNLKNWRDSFLKKFVERRMTSGIIDLDLVTYSFFYDLFDFFFLFLNAFPVEGILLNDWSQEIYSLASCHW